MKTNKVKIKIILIFAIFVCFSNYVYSQFGGGSGTQNSPYEIYNLQHLEALADSVKNGNNWSRNKYFKVMNDITDSVRTVIGITGKNYLENSKPFRGNFDGNNKTRFKILLDIKII